jgi:hypothetical protein
MSFVLLKFFSTGQPGLLKGSYPHRPSSMGIGVVFNPTACFPGHFAERLSLCSRFSVEIFFPPGWILNYFFPPKKNEPGGSLDQGEMRHGAGAHFSFVEPALRLRGVSDR